MTVTRMAGGTAIGAAMLIGLSAPSAEAGYVVDLTQNASGVVATGSGSIDLTGLFFQPGGVFGGAQMNPSVASLITGPSSPTTEGDLYFGISSTPTSFGSGGRTLASSGSGDLVGIAPGTNHLFVPVGYMSDTALLDTATYSGATFASLGVTPGTYEWTWGSGGADQNFTLVVVPVPELSTWAMMLLGFAGLRLAGRGALEGARRSKTAAAAGL